MPRPGARSIAVGVPAGEIATPSQPERARAFKALHVRGHPLVLFNIWDAGTARAAERAGAPALATGSWSVAAAHGQEDGEQLPFPLVLANLERIIAAVRLPVSIDLEAGYSTTAQGVAQAVTAVVRAGAVGFNLEDQISGRDGLYSIAEQSARLAAARAAAEQLGIPAFVNARTDLFLNAAAEAHDTELLASALERAAAYAPAGADGFFVPGLRDETLIAELCQRSPLPVNIMLQPGSPTPARLAALGVARISHGPGPYRLAMQLIEDAAREALRLAT